MKSEKLLSMAKLCVKKINTKNLSVVLSLILTLFVFNSCKKDLLVPSSNKPPKSEFIVENVNYNNFINSINLNSLGFLKPKLNPTNRDKLLSINDNNSLGNLSIYTDSVRRIINKQDTSYVFQMALSSPKAIAFRNLTINTNKGKITAFITTYTPTREWIDARKNNKPITFKGDISIAGINLNGTLNLLQGFSSNSETAGANSGKTMSAVNQKKMVAMEICNEFLVYNLVAYGCSQGNHMPFDIENCPWNNGAPVPSGQYKGGYNYTATNVVICHTVNIPDPGSQGPTPGSGGTTPNPPGDYDPCNTETPTVFNTRVNDGLKLAVLPPSPCDEGGGGLPPLVDDGSDSEISFGMFDLEFDNPNETSNNQPILVSSDYNFNGFSNSFSQDEFDNIINNLSNDINDDPIQFYLLATYKHSKVLNSSTYSVSMNTIKVGDFYLTPHYNNQNNLVFYAASRNSNVGIEYIIKANALTKFKDSYTLYKSAADLFYQNGKPELWQIQISAGDYWEGILNSWKSHLSDPGYVLSLAHLYVGSTTNIKTTPVSPTRPAPTPKIKYTIITEPNSRYPSIRIENMSIAEYRNALSQKYNINWQNIGDGKFLLEAGQNRYISYPLATSTVGPTIQYFRNNKSIGKFRFHN